MTTIGSASPVNPNDYDPISTLEKQYSDPPLGRRLTLSIKINKGCLVPGGIETVLKALKVNSKKSSQDSANTSSSNLGIDSYEEAVETAFICDLSEVQISQSDGGEEDSVCSVKSRSSVDIIHHERRNSFDSGSHHGNGRTSPFDFLSNDAPPRLPGKSSSKGGKKVSKLSTFTNKLKKGWDRQVTSIVLQAQKAAGSKSSNSDLLTVGAYTHGGNIGEFPTCLGMTERAAIPSDDSEGLTFRIPIVVPPHLLEKNTVTNGSVIEILLWIRSGAAIFAKSRGLRSYYTVGSASLWVSSLLQRTPNVLTIPLQSQVVHDGMVTITVLNDRKFPPLRGNGWSMTDPKTDTAYSHIPGKKILFNPTLDQSYIFPIPRNDTSSQTDSNLLVATERSTESTVVLPLSLAFSRILSSASSKSLEHGLDVSNKLQYLHDAESVNDPMKVMKSGHAQCQIEIAYILRYSDNAPGAGGLGGGGKAHVTVNLQRPDSIFENCLATASIPTFTYKGEKNYPFSPAISVPFYPRVISKSDPRLLPGLLKTSKFSYFIGKLRVQIYDEGIGAAGVDVFSPIGPTSSVGTSSTSYDLVIEIEHYLNCSQTHLLSDDVVQAPIVDPKSGETIAALAFKLTANTLEGMVDKNAESLTSSVAGGATCIDGGLISLVGLDTLMEDDKTCYPRSDIQVGSLAHATQNPSNIDTKQRRTRQIATMGEFLSFDYMDTHSGCTRATDSKVFLQRADEYEKGMFSQEDDGEPLPPNEVRDPRPFRPSSSRMDFLLNGIGFNVHVHNLSLLSVSGDEVSGAARASENALYQNVTCGAPADHFRGFGGNGKDEKTFSGGLRRLEANRLSADLRVRETQDALIHEVARYYSELSQKGLDAGVSLRHVPATQLKVAQLRKSCIEATQVLHELTWNIAVRRGNVFSQALGIAVTVYLSHVSDFEKIREGVRADIWRLHGFLITFEGLLSAQGKELGMIEDASVAIAMLRMVSVVLRRENHAGDESDRIPVKESPYVRWLKITNSGYGSKAKFLVEVGLDVEFYEQRIPKPLRNGTSVQFYPILYQMGVDIRQWGANQLSRTSHNGPSTTSGSEDEGDDDEAGTPDKDVLIALNYEAFRKMNAYAHFVNPTNCLSVEVQSTWEQAHLDQQIQQSTHPSLAPLFEYIRSSAGKMEHGILDEAATAAARLGGGSAIFCKSGKDRTAMQVTFKQAQFINRYMNNQGNGFGNVSHTEQIVQDALYMRVYGTRLPICEKNVGQSLFAFNALQARFMPEILKPPPRTLAGFLKGGRVFTKGGIES